MREFTSNAQSLVAAAKTKFPADTRLWWIGPMGLKLKIFMEGITLALKPGSTEAMQLERQIATRVEKHGTDVEFIGLPVYVDSRLPHDCAFLAAWPEGSAVLNAGNLLLS